LAEPFVRRCYTIEKLISFSLDPGVRKSKLVPEYLFNRRPPRGVNRKGIEQFVDYGRGQSVSSRLYPNPLNQDRNPTDNGINMAAIASQRSIAIAQTLSLNGTNEIKRRHSLSQLSTCDQARKWEPSAISTLFPPLNKKSGCEDE